jgi:hypothetical protein
MTLLLIGILLASILVIENMVSPVQAYVLIWVKSTYMLAMASIATGVLIGYGIYGIIHEPSKESDNEDFDF